MPRGNKRKELQSADVRSCPARSTARARWGKRLCGAEGSLLEANDAASKAAAGVAGLERVGVATLAKVVLTVVHDDSAAEDGGDGDLSVGDVHLGDAVAVGGDVAEVAGVALVVGGSAVVAAVRVEVAAGRGAAVGGVAELVDVEAVLARGEAAEAAGHANLAFAERQELDGALGAIGADKHAHSALLCHLALLRD
eukprot:CAMPEP_0202038698 /NCGR_PEP_ID=MMETSP0962-20130828/11590_1 /ASSEMBLY_ACC=CAM_ASM_000488 /TAXON_ID=4773 /ORGANISM="Schizochytrium aggregatum, Strain ATCC28209" /LENGTH=195 /DNA_ID=CAMNT_0048602875 /DNA_START=23 /DNA_END=610 /DNA_ORIENTATION=-